MIKNELQIRIDTANVDHMCLSFRLQNGEGISMIGPRWNHYIWISFQFWSIYLCIFNFGYFSLLISNEHVTKTKYNSPKLIIHHFYWVRWYMNRIIQINRGPKPLTLISFGNWIYQQFGYFNLSKCETCRRQIHDACN